jgi:hypothetical protein
MYLHCYTACLDRCLLMVRMMGKNKFLYNKSREEGLTFVKCAARKTVTSQTAAWSACAVEQSVLK